MISNSQKANKRGHSSAQYLIQEKKHREKKLAKVYLSQITEDELAEYKLKKKPHRHIRRISRFTKPTLSLILQKSILKAKSASRSLYVRLKSRIAIKKINKKIKAKGTKKTKIDKKGHAKSALSKRVIKYLKTLSKKKSRVNPKVRMGAVIKPKRFKTAIRKRMPRFWLRKRTRPINKKWKKSLVLSKRLTRSQKWRLSKMKSNYFSFLKRRTTLLKLTSVIRRIRKKIREKRSSVNKYNPVPKLRAIKYLTAPEARENLYFKPNKRGRISKPMLISNFKHQFSKTIKKNKSRVGWKPLALGELIKRYKVKHARKNSRKQLRHTYLIKKTGNKFLFLMLDTNRGCYRIQEFFL